MLLFFSYLSLKVLDRPWCVHWRVMRKVKKMAIRVWFYKSQTALVLIVCDLTQTLKEEKESKLKQKEAWWFASKSFLICQHAVLFVFNLPLLLASPILWSTYTTTGDLAVKIGWPFFYLDMVSYVQNFWLLSSFFFFTPTVKWHCYSSGEVCMGSLCTVSELPRVLNF